MPDELSQNDIDALLSGGAAPGEESEPEEDAPAPAPAESRTLEMPDFGASQLSAGGPEGGTFDLLMDVNMNVKIELGRSAMLVEDILNLKGGSVVPLDKLAGDPVDVMVNDKLIARGEVMVINDVFCVRVTEILSPKQRLIALK